MNRIVYIDFLKLIAVFGVIIIHVTAPPITKLLPFGSFDWYVNFGFNRISRFSVPMFFMLSGVFFLAPKKSISIKSIWVVYIKRIIIAFLFFSSIYAAIGCLSGVYEGGGR